ncbi:hypothetical protein BDV95DRAFT_593623 [Massariosphaeria phaeospora]|uniref:Uncharacterized protein n=1 Tax=Massariosphaeria phaeospora TaxID=100035 RepID=A0A7C8MA34_9PLEO|nr:hypothetical protein BDV95DRAFT_593623 [Massariosphaeria phaeospora]
MPASGVCRSAAASPRDINHRDRVMATSRLSPTRRGHASTDPARSPQLPLIALRPRARQRRLIASLQFGMRPTVGHSRKHFFVDSGRDRADHALEKHGRSNSSKANVDRRDRQHAMPLTPRGAGTLRHSSSWLSRHRNAEANGWRGASNTGRRRRRLHASPPAVQLRNGRGCCHRYNRTAVSRSWLPSCLPRRLPDVSGPQSESKRREDVKLAAAIGQHAETLAGPGTKATNCLRLVTRPATAIPCTPEPVSARLSTPVQGSTMLAVGELCRRHVRWLRPARLLAAWGGHAISGPCRRETKYGLPRAA